VVVTILEIAAIAIAYLQFRDDSEASRSSHWLVWATIGLGAIWLFYAVLVGLVVIIGQIWCFGEICRGPIR
jgi:hypothetical protein